MPIAKVQLPDGRIGRFEVPEGTTPDQVLEFAQKNVLDAPTEPELPTDAPTRPTGRLGTPKPFQSEPDIAPDELGKKWASVGSGGLTGMMDVPYAVAQLMTRGLEGVAPKGSSLEQWAANRRMGVDLRVQGRERERAAERAGQGGVDVPRALGNIVTMAPFAAAAPAGGSLLARTATGAGMGGLTGGLQPVTQGDFGTEKGKQVGLGALSGGVAALGTGLASKAIRPSAKPEVELLRKEGVYPSPGQTTGGPVKWAEESLRSTPVAGYPIRSGQIKAVEQFNRAAINRTLRNVGQSLPDDIPVGRTAIDHAKTVLSDAYDSLLPTMKATADRRFATDMGRIAQSVKADLTEEQQKLFVNKMTDLFSRQSLRNRNIGGEEAKKIISDLNKRASDFGKSADPLQRELGKKFEEAKRAFSDLLRRSNPSDKAKELAKIDRAWGQYKIVERAASMQGAKEGVFTPAQLSNAVRSQDKSLGKGRFARGRANMQDLSDAGQKVLGSTIPDSGTAERLLSSPYALAALPITIPMSAVTGPLYSNAGRRLMSGLLSSRPQSFTPVARLLDELSPALAAGAAPAGIGLLSQ